ncbi:MAG: hypothetical protein PUD59_00050 [bacterium]|nr:hypothetical protein [bacterium]
MKMTKIIKQEIEVEVNKIKKKKIEFICEFANVKYKLINSSIRTIENTNLSYIEPHKLIVKNKTILIFNYETTSFIENLKQKILIKDLENYIRSI